MPDDFFKWLGIKPQPEKGHYFVPLRRYMSDQLKLGAAPEAKAIDDEAALCSRRSWKASEHPKIAAWLKANEKPLAFIIDATNRTHYYMPLVPKRSNQGPSPLIGALLPSVQTCRDVAQALTARALLRTGEGRFEDAWQDLLACHRLGRLVGRGTTLIELLVGIAIDAVATKADTAFLEHAKLKNEHIENCLHDLQKLASMPRVADKIDFGERLSTLQIVVLIDRYGPEALENLDKAVPAKQPSPWAKLFRANVDYEPALRNINRWYDQIAKTLRVEDRSTREKQLAQLDMDLRKLKAKTQESMPGALELLFAKDSAKIRGETIGNILITLLMPAFNKVQSAADRCEQVQNNLYLAFALAAYQRDHGRYPKELDELAPKYLKKIPNDLFSGKPLVYRPSENGYLLYSVGVNGLDEQGNGYEDDPRGDDLSVRMPLPKQK
jgi:type II secretory pathway pseudopilin PulG